MKALEIAILSVGFARTRGPLPKVPLSGRFFLSEWVIYIRGVFQGNLKSGNIRKAEDTEKYYRCSRGKRL
jgi:hypothetical protein